MNEKVTLKLFGGHTFNNVKIESVPEGVPSATLRSAYDRDKLRGSAWGDDTLLNSNFNGNTDGSNFEGSFENIQYYKIFKTIGNNKFPHFVAQTTNYEDTIVKDYVVGSYCPYKYYIYPMCKEEFDNIEYYVAHSPIVVDYSQDTSCVKLIGLIQDETNPNEYYIDKNSIWNIFADVKDSGFNINNDKTFTDSENMMSQETVGAKNYITKDITGMIAKFDCESINKYNLSDTYDELIRFKDFVSSASMKLLIDVRGIILVGDVIGEPRIDYEQAEGFPATATFTFKQLEDLKNVKIHGETYAPETEGDV